jgi:hypothetical protein
MGYQTSIVWSILVLGELTQARMKIQRGRSHVATIPTGPGCVAICRWTNDYANRLDHGQALLPRAGLARPARAAQLLGLHRPTEDSLTCAHNHLARSRRQQSVCVDTLRCPRGPKAHLSEDDQTFLGETNSSGRTEHAGFGPAICGQDRAQTRKHIFLLGRGSPCLRGTRLSGPNLA